MIKHWSFLFNHYMISSIYACLTFQLVSCFFKWKIWLSFVVGVSAGLLFFVPMPLFCIPSPRIDPCDKRRGRYGSNSSESPPPRYGPPTQPQQGISMVELPNPGLAPSTKPERDANHLYPNSPPRYEEIESPFHSNFPPSFEWVANEKPSSPPSAAAAEL